MAFGPTVSGFDEDSKHLWYLADSQLSLAYKLRMVSTVFN